MTKEFWIRAYAFGKMSFGQMLSDKQLLHFAEKGYVVYEHGKSLDSRLIQRTPY